MLYVSPFFEALVVGVILLAMLAAAVLIALATVGGNRAIRQLTEVARDYALADLALRHESVRRQISFADANEVLPYLRQLAFDLTHETYELHGVSAEARTPSLQVKAAGDRQLIFTPAPEKIDTALLGEVATYAVDRMSANIFVIEELQAAAATLGLRALPRTERWTLLLITPKDLMAEVRKQRRKRQPFWQRLFA